MGGPPVTSRGGMVHLILSLCRQFEEAFGKAVDGGKGGGEQILRVFEERLGQNIQQLQFKKVGFSMKESKKRKEKTTPLGVIQDKLMVNPSFPLPQSNLFWPFAH